eukprot:COSAG06_NODE_599_length_13905_cov_347.954657_6_plen_121_part_00
MEVVAGCAIDTRKKLTENLLLAGGNTLFDGLPEMMFKKVKAEGKARCGTLKMAAPKQRSISAWLGAHSCAILYKNALVRQARDIRQTISEQRAAVLVLCVRRRFDCGVNGWLCRAADHDG